MSIIKDPYFEIEGISNSRLSLINIEQGGSPSRYNNKDYEKNEYSKALERGSAIHLALLEPEKFIQSEVVRPTQSVAKIVDMVFKEGLILTPETAVAMARKEEFYSNWRDETICNKILDNGGLEYFDFLVKRKKAEEQGAICLDKATWTIVNNCIESVKKHTLAMKYLAPKNLHNYKEQAIFWTEQFDETILPCKGKIDDFSIDEKNKVIYLNDLKTTGKPIDEFYSSFRTFRYHRQMAFYKKAVLEFAKQNFGEAEWKVEVRMIVVETTGDHITKVFRVSENELEKGTKEYKRLLRLIAYHTRNEQWDAPKIQGITEEVEQQEDFMSYE